MADNDRFGQRGIEIPPFMEEGSIAGAMHALRQPQTALGQMINDTYSVASRAINNCMELLPFGTSLRYLDDGRVVKTERDSDIQAVRITESPDVERGFYHGQDLLRIANKGFWQRDNEEHESLEVEIVLSPTKARASELWGSGKRNVIEGVDLPSLVLIGAAAVTELAGFKVELSEIVQFGVHFL